MKKMLVVRDIFSDEVYGVFTTYRKVMKYCLINDLFPQQAKVLNYENIYASRIMRIAEVYGEDWKRDFAEATEEEAKDFFQNNKEHYALPFMVDEAAVDEGV